MSSVSRRLAASLAICALVNCGGNGPSPPTSPPAADPTIANVAGTWTGSIESSAFASRPITAILTQIGVDCVDGAWRTAESELVGAISGFAQPNNSFSGFLSVEGSTDGTGLCPGVFRVTGSASATGIKWTWVNDGNCPNGIEQTVTFKLQR